MGLGDRPRMARDDARGLSRDPRTEEDAMEWVDRLAEELHLGALSAHEKEHLLSASRDRL